ncbi:MAG TPA: PAS domain S-box protein [Flavitalea sp.]|nr:PAS domain S-box protein [Flavitalea sp.]
MKYPVTSETDEILHALRDAVLVVDHHGIILFVNEASEKLFGQSKEQLMHEVFGFPIAQQAVQEIRILKRGRPIVAQMLASPINWHGMAASVLSIRDITEQRATQDALSEQTKLLSIKSEENAQFASLASHDLKEPLRKMDIYSSMLLTNHDLPSLAKEHVEKIRLSVDRMRKLIQGIAELTQVLEAQGAFTPVDLNKIVQSVILDLQSTVEEKGAIIEFTKLPIIQGQGDKLYQLFLNLVGNALKYVRAGVVPRIDITSELLGDKVIVHIRDNGIGFDNKYALQLFLPFKRLHSRNYEGMG